MSAINTANLQLSIVIPFLNEVESLRELHQWITTVMVKHNFSYEIVFVDDGSTDNSWKIVQELSAIDSHIKAIKFRRNYGKSAGLNVGFEHASGDVIITMDADLQDSPEEIPELYDMIMKEDFDIVSGWKKKRYDPITKTIPTKIYNGVTRWLTGIHLHDMNCGLKAYKREVIKSIEVYGEMHRYIPVIAKWAGFKNIGEKVVQHQARKYGVTKFGISRFLYGFLDLFSIMFMGKFGKRPMHFFGALGTLLTFTGSAILAYLSIEKLFWHTPKIADRPLFFLGILLIIVGFQLFITGFIAELVTRNAVDRNQYKIAEVISRD
jgi:glycosyltransferase involved in cell wall biosynthesis